LVPGIPAASSRLEGLAYRTTRLQMPAGFAVHAPPRMITAGMKPERRLFLLDGMALIYRAHFVLIAKPIRTSYGMNTSALYGFTNVLMDLIKNEKPTHMAVVFDTAAPTARHTEFRFRT
jgi:5'-3' exonuclease